jgi:hypothetical protein
MENVGPFEDWTGELEALAALGMPENVRRYVAAQKYPRSWRGRFNRYYLVVGLAIIGIAAVPAASLFILADRLHAARLSFGYFSYENHGWGAVAVAFGVLILGVCVAPFAIRSSDPAFIEYFSVRGMLQAAKGGFLQRRINGWLSRAISARLASDDPRRFLVEYSRRPSRWLVWPGVALVILGGLAAPIDLAYYDLGLPAGIERHSAFVTTNVPWESIQRIEVGCAEFKNQPDVAYDLITSGGDRIGTLLRAGHVEIERLAPLDAVLRRRGLPVGRAVFTGGIHRGEPYWTPGCVEHFAQKNGISEEEMEKLLSMTDAPRQ